MESVLVTLTKYRVWVDDKLLLDIFVGLRYIWLFTFADIYGLVVCFLIV